MTEFKELKIGKGFFMGHPYNITIYEKAVSGSNNTTEN